MNTLQTNPLLICFGSIRNYEGSEKLCKPRLRNPLIRILELRYEPRMGSANNNQRALLDVTLFCNSVLPVLQ